MYVGDVFIDFASLVFSYTGAEPTSTWSASGLSHKCLISSIPIYLLLVSFLVSGLFSIIIELFSSSNEDDSF